MIRSTVAIRTVTDPRRPRWYTVSYPCPVCGGWESLPRGKGIRCHGYQSTYTKRVAFCSQTPSDEEANGVYKHRTDGSCDCGTPHDSEGV